MTAPVTEADLRKAIRTMDTIGITPLESVWAARPQGMFGKAYDSWNKRRNEAETKARKQLESEGVQTSSRWDGARVVFLGISAGSTMGLAGALKNWKAAAEKRLSGSAGA